jgi:hypothetical protein
LAELVRERKERTFGGKDVERRKYRKSRWKEVGRGGTAYE